jgi:protoporphyrinogen IX oxidase
MSYLHIKALHIIFVVSWFAALFYLPRLLVYHVEASQRPANEADVLVPALIKYQNLLYRAIMVPAMVITLITGFSLLYMNQSFLEEPWMHLKLGFVALLLGYHAYCKYLMNQMAKGVYPLSSIKLRLWNEVATVILFAVVFLVVLKNTVDWVYATLGLVVFSVVIFTAVFWVKKKREKSANAN